MFRQRPALWLSILLTIIFLILAFIRFGFLESLEMDAYDLRMRLRAAGPETRTDLVLVDVDNDSINKLGRWPWPRSLIAQMIDKLKANQARVIGLALIFSEPETGEGLKLIQDLKEEFTKLFPGRDNQDAQAFVARLNQARGDLDYDKKLTDSIAAAGNVVLPVFLRIGPYAQPEENQPDLLMRHGMVHIQSVMTEYMSQADDIALPIDTFSNNALGLGFLNVNIFPDGDGAVRRDTMLVDYKGLVLPSFTLKLAQSALGIPNDKVHVLSPEEGREGIQVGKIFVPTDPASDFYVTFTDARSFPRYSFFDVLNDKVQASAFKNKIVLIGVSATGVDTPLVTPIDSSMPSSLFAVNVVQNLLAGGFVIRTGLMSVIELVLLLVVGIFLALVLPRLSARNGALASMGILVVLVAAGVWLFIGPGIWLKIIYPVLLTIFGYAAVTTAGYFFSEAGMKKAEGESAEVNRMLGLSFQTQGQLDMAFDKFRRVPVDEGMKDILFNLGLDYERKRMFNKAVSVYEYIKGHDSGYRDITEKIKKLNVASETMIFGLGTGAQTAEDGTMVFDENTRPTLGRYEIIEELGKGAMGIVYLGRDPQIGRETAIKTIRFNDEYEEDEAVKIKEQFFSEAKTAGMLTHPNIVTIYDAGEDHDLSYIAMELLDGSDLKDYSDPNSLLPMREVIRIVADVADALGYAHTKGVVHRDVKPANIMLCKNGAAKVTDFGIARAMATSKTKTGVVKGTPFYMSPEQIKGLKVDGRSDIFSLAVMFYELLSGMQPFRADDLTALIYKITSEEAQPITAVNPKVPKAISQIIEKALIKDREKRYQKAEQMAEHLRIVLKKIDELAARKANGEA